MMLRLTQLHFAAVVLAITAVSLTAPAARAFTQENLNMGQGGNSRFADPDDQVKNFGQGATPFGPGGPVVQFGAQSGATPYSPSSPFSRFHGNSYVPTPEPYARPLGNGD
jgi:hypothetical protein